MGDSCLHGQANSYSGGKARTTKGAASHSLPQDAPGGSGQALPPAFVFSACVGTRGGRPRGQDSHAGFEMLTALLFSACRRLPTGSAAHWPPISTPLEPVSRGAVYQHRRRLQLNCRLKHCRALRRSEQFPGS